MIGDKHSCGPWSWDGRYCGDITCKDGSPVAGVMERNSEQEAKANAILTQSAPDMLATLCRVACYLADLNGSQWIIGSDAGAVDMRQRAKCLHDLVMADIRAASGEVL